MPFKEFYDAIKYLNPGEYSTVIKSELNEFMVVQLIEKFNKEAIIRIFVYIEKRKLEIHV